MEHADILFGSRFCLRLRWVAYKSFVRPQFLMRVKYVVQEKMRGQY